jgi:beta-lactamase regulating signal transducer with metallopeptidase domain
MVQAFSWMLIHSLWQGLLLAILAAVVLMLTKRSSAVIRYNLVFAQLLLFVSGCIFTFIWEWNSNSVVQPIAGAIGHVPFLTNMVKPFTETAIRYFSLNAPFILGCWFLLFIARSVRIMGGLVYVSRARYRNIYSPGDEWKAKIAVLCQRLQLNKAVTLLESGYVKMPLVLGHFKPVILIPAGLLAGLPVSQIEAVLLHELAHIRRNDYFVNLLQNITEAIFFFNPGLLWISSLLRDEREHCCDDIALAQTKNKREFIEALISFKEHALHGSNYAVAFPGKKDHLLKRVSRILYDKNHTLSGIEKVFFMAGIVVLGVIVTAAGIMEIRTIVSTVKVTTMYTSPISDTTKVYIQHTTMRVVKKDKAVCVQVSSRKAAVVRKEQQLLADVQSDSDCDQTLSDRIQADKDREQADRDREQADRDRAAAEKDRARAVLDRQRAVLDRLQAEKDREQAHRDRERAMKERASL